MIRLSIVGFIALVWAGNPPTPGPTPKPTPLPVNTADLCFNMGHTPGVDYVVKEGNGTKTPGKEFELRTTLYAWLEEIPEITNCSGIHNWSMIGVEFPYGIDAEIVQGGEHVAWPLIKGQNKTNETLTFEWWCINTGAGFTGIVNVTLELPGYANVTFELEKRCFPNLTPTPEKEKGWSPASVFFFTVFVLTMVFCIVGCGVNYVQKGKTGLEIIPGATTCVECLGKVFRQPRYTPQMDYDAPVGGAPGTSYQTDL